MSLLYLVVYNNNNNLIYCLFLLISGQADISNKHWESLSTQLTKADYHGAYVRVTRGRCPSHVGIEGIVVMDTKYTFKVLGKDNIVRSKLYFYTLIYIYILHKNGSNNFD